MDLQVLSCTVCERRPGFVLRYHANFGNSLWMDKGNLHLARGKFTEARNDYQIAHDKMCVASPISIMIGITQYKLAMVKIKLGTATDCIEARYVQEKLNVHPPTNMASPKHCLP